MILTLTLRKFNRYTNDMTAKKRCSGCKEEKPTTDFYRNRSRPDGLACTCRNCFLGRYKNPRPAAPDLPGESWETLDWAPYEVSDLGRVRRTEWKRGAAAGALIRCYRRSGKGYLGVTIRDNLGVRKDWYTHVLVAEVFLGKRPEGHEVNHLDGNKENNAVGNLEYVTPSQNMKHAVAMGLVTPPRR